MEFHFGSEALRIPFLALGISVADTLLLGVLGVGALLLLSRRIVSLVLGLGVGRHGSQLFRAFVRRLQPDARPR